MMQEEPVPPAADRPGEGGGGGVASRRQAARSAAAAVSAVEGGGGGGAGLGGGGGNPPPPHRPHQAQTRESRGGGGGGGAAPSSAGGGGGGASSAAAALIGRIILAATIILRVALYPLRRAASALFPPGEFDGLAPPGVPDRAARAFSAAFRRRYMLGGGGGGGAGARRGGGGGVVGAVGGADAESDPPPDSGCPFVPTGYRPTIDAIARMGRPSPLLLVYVHSPLHRDSDRFASGTLCDRSVSRYLCGEDMIRCYGASVHTADGAHVANSLGVGGYPYVALLQVKGGGDGGGGGGGGGGGARRGAGGGVGDVTLEMLLKMEGGSLLDLSPPQFLAYVQTCVRAHRSELAEAEARRLRREEEARLRQEQDREYREALESDRRREAERRAEESRIADEERIREEAEREAEAAEARRIEGARAAAGAEPPHAPGRTAKLRLTLPSGKKVDRRFRSEDTVGTVRAFLVVHFHENDIPIHNFSLSTNYPKTTYDEDGITLEEAGLCPQAVLMVQDLDA